LSTPERVVPDPHTVGVAVYDATCLFSKHARYLLLGFAVRGVVQARWSRRLLEETAANLAGKLRGDSLQDLGRWLKDEAELVRDSLVEGYDRWLPLVELPDTGDAHVVAAAIECGAGIIVTDNVRDFPATSLAKFDIEAVQADDFTLRCIDANPVIAAQLVAGCPDPDQFLGRLVTVLPRTAEQLHSLLG